MILQSVISQDTYSIGYELVDLPYWIADQYKNFSVKITNGLIETSNDNSLSFGKSLEFDTSKITQAVIMKNENIMFFTSDNKVYLSNIDLDSIVEKTVLQEDGVTPISIHTPVNSAYPGRYFNCLFSIERYDETDLIVWGNYHSFLYGAAPSHIFYTNDFGATIKVAYAFGQHSWYKDDGTPNGGPTGNVLGDPTNPIKVRHIHDATYSSINDKWYVNTGDEQTSIKGENEIRWLEGTYDDIGDTWSWRVMDFGSELTTKSQLKSGSIVAHGNFLYYGTDTTEIDSSMGGNSGVNGIWRCRIDDFENINLHEQLFQFAEDDDLSLGMTIDQKTSEIVFNRSDFRVFPNIDNNIGVLNQSRTEVFSSERSTTKDYLQIKQPNNLGEYLIQHTYLEELPTTCSLLKPI